MTENHIELGSRQSISRESINMGINVDQSVSTRRMSITSEPIQHITAEDIKTSKRFRLWMTFFWIVSGAVFLLYFYQIVQQHANSLKAPSSTVLIEDQPRVPLPHVVVCNWNQNGNVSHPVPTEDCEECLLVLHECTNLNNFEDCSSDWTHEPVQTPYGLFDCYSYNNNNKNPKYSVTTGYSGSVSTIWKLKTFEKENPPVSRAGIQVSYLLPDGLPINPTIVYNEYKFASLGLDAFYTLKLVRTIHMELSETDPEYNTSRYEAVSSSVNLLTLNQNDDYDYVGVSFAFQTLSLEIVQFDTSYTLNNFFGDFAGMLGTLMGLDVIKVAAGLPIIYLAIRERILAPVADHFNG